MTPERWQQIDKLLEQALEHQPVRRNVFLDSACDGDNELRRDAGGEFPVIDTADQLAEGTAICRKRLGYTSRSLLPAMKLSLPARL